MTAEKAAQAAPKPVAHTARVHAWYVSSEGKETHITRRDDGKWYINTTDPSEKAEYLPVRTIADLFLLAAEEDRPHGWTARLRGGEDFDNIVGPHLDPDRYGPPTEEDE